MKAGKEYERFVFEKLRRLFPNAQVMLNDRIAGNESGLSREIDVSVRMTVADASLLYIVQCKDWASPVDINTLGAFAAVMQDVGAAKGFLLCTSGFRDSNHKYALARGIELVTIEDVESERWSTDVQIPYVYVRWHYNFTAAFEIVANAALVEANRDRELVIDLRTVQFRCSEFPPTGLRELVAGKRGEHPTADEPATRIEIAAPDLQIRVAGIWSRSSCLSIERRCVRRRYFKYLTPTAYAHLRDHVRMTTLPLHVRLEQISAQLDNTFVEMAPDAPQTFQVCGSRSKKSRTSLQRVFSFME